MGLMDDESRICLASFLDEYFKSTSLSCRISNFKATVLPSLIIDETTENFSPMLEWREGNDEIMAFVLIPAAPMEPCSFLMHYARHCPLTGRRKTWVSWRVHRLEYLNGLFRQAQTVDGLLTWTKNDLMRFYLEKEFDDTSDLESSISRGR